MCTIKYKYTEFQKMDLIRITLVLTTLLCTINEVRFVVDIYCVYFDHFFIRSFLVRGKYSVRQYVSRTLQTHTTYTRVCRPKFCLPTQTTNPSRRTRAYYLSRNVIPTMYFFSSDVSHANKRYSLCTRTR